MSQHKTGPARIGVSAARGCGRWKSGQPGRTLTYDRHVWRTAGLTRREGVVDLARLTAVDVHVHVEADHDGRMSLPEDFAEASSAYFGVGHHRPTVDEIAAYYRER